MSDAFPARVRPEDADQVLAALMDAVRDERTWRRQQALAAVRALRGGGALLPGLVAALRDGGDAGRRNAARSLLAARAAASREALQLLARLAVHDPDGDVRVLAASALGESGTPAARAALEQALRDASANVAAAAADALGVLADPRAVPSLIAALDPADPWRAIAACVALGRLRDARAVDALAALTGDPMVGPSAVEALGEIRDPAALPALHAAAESGSVEARSAAMEAAASILGYHDLEPPAWLRAAAGADEGALRERLAAEGDDCAAILLGAAGSASAAAALVDALADPDRAAVAAVGIGFLPPRVAASTVVAALETSTAVEPAELLAALPPLGGEDAARVARFLAASDPAVRAAAAEALGRADDPAVAAVLGRAMEDPASRGSAVRALAHGGAADAETLAALLDDPDAAVRAAAAEGLARRPAAADARRIARALETELDPSVRRLLVAALGAAGGDGAADVLAPLADAGDAALRFAAVQALGRTRSPRAFPPLLRALASGDAALETAALRAMGELGDERGVEPVAERLREGDREVRRAAARALRLMAPPAAAHRLLHALADPDWRVRLSAVRAFARIGAEGDAGARLREVADGDPDALVRRAAAQAVGAP